MSATDPRTMDYVLALEAERDEAIAERDAARDCIERALAVMEGRAPVMGGGWGKDRTVHTILTEGQET